MRKRILGVCFLAVLALAGVPASAGPVTAEVRMTRGAFVFGQIPGGFGFAILARFEQARLHEPGQILPANAVPQFDPNLGLGPQETGDPIYRGCIGLITTLGADTNCRELENVTSPEEAMQLFSFDNLPKITEVGALPATMSMDPAMTEGVMNFSAMSHLTGRRLTVVTALNGVGDVSNDPFANHKLEPAAPAAPTTFLVDGRLALQREATVRSGMIKSEIYGGGAISGSTGAMFQGPAAHVDADLRGFVCAPALGGCKP